MHDARAVLPEQPVMHPPAQPEMQCRARLQLTADVAPSASAAAATMIQSTARPGERWVVVNVLVALVQLPPFYCSSLTLLLLSSRTHARSRPALGPFAE